MTTQSTVIPQAEQKEFVAHFLEMLRIFEAAAHRDRNMFDQRWVESACRVWFRMTGEKITPKWLPSTPDSACGVAKLEKIPKKDQADAIHLFWLLLTSCDTEADNENDDALRAKLVGWYAQWNRITGEDSQPRWVDREKQKEKIE